MIKVICYDQVEFWKSRKRALDFYLEGANMCEGNEAERYVNVCCDIAAGLPVASDHMSDLNSVREKKLTNGSSIRDLGGVIAYAAR